LRWLDRSQTTCPYDSSFLVPHRICYNYEAFRDVRGKVGLDGLGGEAGDDVVSVVLDSWEPFRFPIPDAVQGDGTSLSPRIPTSSLVSLALTTDPEGDTSTGPPSTMRVTGCGVRLTSFINHLLISAPMREVQPLSQRKRGRDPATWFHDRSVGTGAYPRGPAAVAGHPTRGFPRRDLHAAADRPSLASVPAQREVTPRSCLGNRLPAPRRPALWAGGGTVIRLHPPAARNAPALPHDLTSCSSTVPWVLHMIKQKFFDKLRLSALD
jgi:hypothetical protein